MSEPKPIYDLPYFRAKFEAIPEELWTVGKLSDNGCRCAYGHCGVIEIDDGIAWNEESRALDALFGDLCVAEVNDGKSPSFQQATPQARILAALDQIEEGLNG